MSESRINFNFPTELGETFRKALGKEGTTIKFVLSKAILDWLKTRGLYGKERLRRKK